MSSMYALFTKGIGVKSPFEITNVDFKPDCGELHITIDYTRDGEIPCPECGKPGKECGSASRKWRHPSFFQYNAYLHSSVPIVICPVCGVKTVEAPWNRPGSGFVPLFDL